MKDDKNKNMDYNGNSNMDTDTRLTDLVDVNTARIDTSNGNEPSLFAANNLYKKTADNLARAEAMVDEKPLRTEKTLELERREAEDSE